MDSDLASAMHDIVAANGARWLDQHGAWAREIDPTRLDMTHNGWCILGQLGPVFWGVAGYYSVIFEFIHRGWIKESNWVNWSADHGFSHAADSDWHALRRAWERQIVVRTT